MKEKIYEWTFTKDATNYCKNPKIKRIDGLK